MNENHDTNPAQSIHKKITGIAAIAGPLLLLASTVAYAAAGDGLNVGELGGAIQVWAYIAIGVAVVGLCRTFERTAPKAAVALSVLGVVAAAIGSGYGIDSLQAAVFDTGSLQETESAAMPFALQLPGILSPLTLAALGIVLARTGVASKALAGMLVVGAVLFPMSRIPDIEALAVTSDLLLVASLAPIGARLLGGRTERRSVAEPAAATA